MSNENETELLAAFVHGCLAALHALGFIYNLRRRNWKSAWFHATAFMFDVYATYLHWRDSRRK